MHCVHVPSGHGPSLLGPDAKMSALQKGCDQVTLTPSMSRLSGIFFSPHQTLHYWTFLIIERSKIVNRNSLLHLANLALIHQFPPLLQGRENISEKSLYQCSRGFHKNGVFGFPHGHCRVGLSSKWISEELGWPQLIKYSVSKGIFSMSLCLTAPQRSAENSTISWWHRSWWPTTERRAFHPSQALAQIP